jgi:glucose uptake protein GlcU
MKSFFFILSFIISISTSNLFISASDDDEGIQRGCGIFLPSTFSPLPPSTNTAAQNRSFYNNFCNNWQCSRAVQIVVATLSEVTSPTFVCVRGGEEGEPCLIDSDCYGKDVACQTKTIWNSTTNKNTTTSTCEKTAEDNSKSPVYGFIALIVTAFFWGSNFIPARQAKAGNGILFQFIMCSGIATVGFLVQVFRSTGDLGFVFYPSACVGGMLWATANTLCIPIIQLTGMGLAVSLWSSSNMVVGWAFSTFGVWGLTTPHLARPGLSYVGAVFGCICFAILSLVRPTRHDTKAKKNSAAVEDNGSSLQSGSTDKTPLIESYSPKNNNNNQNCIDETVVDAVSKKEVVAEDGDDEEEEFPIIALVGGLTRARILGVVCALLCGTVFGLNNDPVVHLMDNYKSFSKSYIAKTGPNGLDYVFSHFVGTFFMSLLILLILGIYEQIRDKYPTSRIGRLPVLFGKVEPTMKLVWPAFLCGVGWALAQTFSFIAATQLGMEISYPISSLGPSLVSVLWSVFYFKELEGTTNIVMLIVAFGAAGISAGLVVASRSD